MNEDTKSRGAAQDTKDKAFSAPAIELPKGGGAIRGIGEKFAANPVTGTASMAVPIATSPARSGFGPQLSLSYDSGSGNGPFGFGWSLSLPSISRKTDKGLPRYRDADESDVYVLAGAEDLVPVVRSDGTRFADAATFPGFVIHRYRPRIEGAFARVERWTNTATGEIHWRSITADNVTTLYGTDNRSRIVDPEDPCPANPTRVFSWLISESHDDKGQAIVYEYVPENGDNVDRGQSNERNRVRTANRYLKRVKYGNRVSRLVEPDLGAASWMFEVVFDYGERHYEELELDPNRPESEQHRFVRASPSPGQPWPVRPDPFSSHRAGFEVRTYRRCRRVLMFHHIPDLATGEPGYDGLVRSTDFDYADLDYGPTVPVDDELAHQGSTRFASFIRAVTQCGYVRDNTQAVVVHAGAEYATYLRKSLPPLAFEYSKAVIQDRVVEVDATSLENVPVGLDGSTCQWVDLDGEGISGMLTELPGAWFYKPNLGDGRFGALQKLASRPSLAALNGGGQQLLDLAGDGQLDLVVLSRPTPGFFERTRDESWDVFRTFRQLPNIAWDDPNLRFIDLDGDGHADVLITERDAFTWHPSAAEDGFGPAQSVLQARDEERGPRLVFADGTQSIYLADMCGDGLTDLVRIRNGEVCYWANLGHGRFGAKVTMDNAPRFDSPEQFDQRRVRVADIDGSGTSDIIYVGRDGVRLYFNQSGNGWSGARALRQFPPVDALSSVSTADLTGNGTACLVWSSSLPGAVRRPLRYVDLLGGTKPHLLNKWVNNLGAEVDVRYVASTRFYLQDKRDGRPWATRLPFPVHVIERVVEHDRLSGNRFVTRYAYHHGCFDGVEREFRGFGMVEQWDTEEFAALNADGQAPTATNLDASSHVPPLFTRTWFHTGAYLGRDHLSRFFAGLLDANDVGEYYREPGLDDARARALLLDDTVLPTGLTVEEEREACRALKGSMLRHEVYALDGTDRQQHPYAVTEQNFTVRALQPRGGNRHAVFFTHARESIVYHYERDPADPRVGHSLTLEVDQFGHVLRSASIGYGRRQPDSALSAADQARQTAILIQYTENRVTNAVDAADAHRAPAPCESCTYEITGLTCSAGASRFTFDDVLAGVTAAAPIDYEENPTAGLVQKRLIERARTYYRSDDMASRLPAGVLESLALPFEAYRLAFTPGLIDRVYGGRASDAVLEQEGGYVHLEDGNWWVPSGRIFYSPNPADTAAQELAHARQHFFLPRRYRHPFHAAALTTDSCVSHDIYDLLVQETRDAFGNRVTVGERSIDPAQPPVRLAQDYRVLQPALVMDANRNRTATAFDALGMVVGTVVMGKPEQVPVPGDRLPATFDVEPTQSVVDEFLANPGGPMAAALLDQATTRVVYDLAAYLREPDPAKKLPVVVATLSRETHASEPAPADGARIQVSFAYTDGFGREMQKKIQAEPGPVPARDAAGMIVVGADGRPQMTPNAVSPRWVGTGWTVFNNKGKPVRQYESFFTDTHRFEFDVRIGVSPVLFYDPVERVVATLHPDHTWEKMVFDPWRQETWDVNDTVLVADPRTDADVGPFFSRLATADYLPTWHALRTDPAHALSASQRWPDPRARDAETRAAEKASVHAATPAVTHTDSLGRAFFTVAHNRFKYSDTALADPPVEEFHCARIVLDIEGNPRELIDAMDRVVTRHDYDMLGNTVHEASMEAGERWTLNDVAGKPLYAWDDRGHIFRTEYDPLRRPIRVYVTGANPASPNQEVLTERLVYGEQHPEAEQRNLRGKVYLHLDQSGAATTEALDFKGNPLVTGRRIATDYRQAIDWHTVDTALPADPTASLEPDALEAVLAPRLDAGTFVSEVAYDALNRPVTVTTPHTSLMQSSVVRAAYNEANLLERLDVNLRGATTNGGRVWTAFITNIDYDVKGRRARVDYGNGVSSCCEFDPVTFRLARMFTRRDPDAYPDDCPQPAPAGWPGSHVQNLHYAYDPAGNVTGIRDDAQQTIYFRNRRVEPAAAYTYDATYRLIEATGREHLGQLGGPPIPPSYDDGPRAGIPHPGDGNAMGCYLERYVYDLANNFLSVQHRGSDPAQAGWTRTYTHTEASQIEPAAPSNRLTSTATGGTTEIYSTLGDGYDAHGNMLRMPHLQVMRWNFKDHLQMTRRQAVNAADTVGVAHQGESTYYVYDWSGNRVRKITESATGQVKDERVYLGGLEIYRRSGAAPVVRETLHVTDGRQLVALVETRTQGDEPGVPQQIVRYQFGNHLGSVSLELDDQARIVSYEEYTPYGSTAYEAVRSQTETPKRYRHTGKERDEENGLYYHGARYYAPWLGTWTSADPVVPSGGASRFVYGQANPVMFTDPDGRAPRKKPPGKVGNIAPHNRQGSALRSAGKRITEHEHIRARINLWLQTFDSQTGWSPYGRAAYGRSATLTIPEDMARIKTRMDMQLRDKLKEAARTGRCSEDLRRQMSIEADIERTKLARQEAINRRIYGGRQIGDLNAVTDERITAAAHYQQGEVFAVGKGQRSPIRGAADAEIDAAIGVLDKPPAAPAAPKPAPRPARPVERSVRPEVRAARPPTGASSALPKRVLGGLGLGVLVGVGLYFASESASEARKRGDPVGEVLSWLSAAPVPGVQEAAIGLGATWTAEFTAAQELKVCGDVAVRFATFDIDDHDPLVFRCARYLPARQRPSLDDFF